MSKRNNKGKSSRGRGGGGAGGGGYGKPHPYGLPDLTRAAKIPVQNTRLVPNAWPVTIGPPHPPKSLRPLRREPPRGQLRGGLPRLEIGTYRQPAASVGRWLQAIFAGCSGRSVPASEFPGTTHARQSLCSIADTVVGGRNGRRSEQRSGLGPHPPAGTEPRIRSAHHLVRSNACFALGTLWRSLQRTGNSGSGRDRVPFCAQASGKMRSRLRTGRRNPAPTEAARSGMLGGGP